MGRIRRSKDSPLTLQRRSKGPETSLCASPELMDVDNAFLVDSDQEDDSHVPDTQPVDERVLKDVVAYVEVRTKTENRSRGVSKQLELLGAKVSKKLTNDVTHVIWKEGKKSSRDRAIKKGISVVSVLWVESCKQNQEHVAESLFPVAAPGETDLLQIGRLKRMKSMQPKAVEEDIQRSSDRGGRKRKRRGMHPSPAPLILNPHPQVFVAETQQPMTPTGLPTAPHTPSLIPDTPTNMKACLDLLDSIKKHNGSAQRRLSITDSPHLSPSTPLQQRLYQCFADEVTTVSHGGTPNASVQAYKSGPTKRAKTLNGDGGASNEDRGESGRGGAARRRSGRGRQCGGTPKSHKVRLQPKDTSSAHKVPLQGKAVEHLAKESVGIKNIGDVEREQGSGKRKRSRRSQPDLQNQNKSLPERMMMSEESVMTSSVNEASSIRGVGEATDKITEGRRGRIKQRKWGSRDEQTTTEGGIMSTADCGSSVDSTTIKPLPNSPNNDAVNSEHLPSSVDNIASTSSAGNGPNSDVSTEKELQESQKPQQRRTIKPLPNSPNNNAVNSEHLPISVDNIASTSSAGNGPNSDVSTEKKRQKSQKPQQRRRSIRLWPSSPNKSTANSAKIPSSRNDIASTSSAGSVSNSGVILEKEPEKNTKPQQRRQSVRLSKGILKDCGSQIVEARERITDDVSSESEGDATKGNCTKRRKLYDHPSVGSQKYLFGDVSQHPRSEYSFGEKDGGVGKGDSNVKKDDISKTSRRGRGKKAEKPEVREPNGKIQTEAMGRDDRDLMSAIPSDVISSSILSSLDINSRPSIEEFQPTGTELLKGRSKVRKQKVLKSQSTQQKKSGSSSASSEESVASSSDDLDATEQKENTTCTLKGSSMITKGKKSKKKKAVTMCDMMPGNKKGKPTIVMTSLHKSDQEIVMAVVKDLGQFVVTDTVCETTTHVIVGENRRTLNVLSGIARGCWLLSMEWVYSSVEAGSWLQEDRYEMSDHFPGAMVSRLAHTSPMAPADSSASPTDLFSACGALFVSPDTNPPRERLVELVELCGGHILRRKADAALCVGSSSSYGKRGSTPVLAERWILDCVTRFKLLPWKPYILQK